MRLLLVSLLVGIGFTSGCDRLSGIGVTPVEARTAEDSIETFLTYQDVLVGKTSDAVVEVFGKPKGVFQKHSGTVWMYSRWCVQFDSNGTVQRLERDIAASGGGRASNQSMALSAQPAPPAKPLAHAGNIIRIANGGQSVDLDALMPQGKIVVVDFYADWCGPCRRIAPQLETLAGNNADLVLIKVDIAKWGTPVTRQYGINSVPNIRVFNRDGKPVGKPTSSFTEVRGYVDKAGG